MLTWILGIVAVLFIYLYGRVRYNNHIMCLEFNRDMYHIEVENKTLKTEIEALHQGNIDLEESYEMVLLDMADQMNLLDGKIIDRDQIIDYHAVNCHGLVADTVEMLMEAIRPTHTDEEPEGVPADG